MILFITSISIDSSLKSLIVLLAFITSSLQETEKKFLLVIGRYDRHSKFNVSNLKKLFKTKEKIFTVPYNTQFFDMQNDHRTLEFFIKYMKEDPSERNGLFVNEVKQLSDHILENIVISTKK